MLYFHVLMFCLVSDENILHHSQPKPNRVKFNYGLCFFYKDITRKSLQPFRSFGFLPKRLCRKDPPQNNKIKSCRFCSITRRTNAYSFFKRKLVNVICRFARSFSRCVETGKILPGFCSILQELTARSKIVGKNLIKSYCQKFNTIRKNQNLNLNFCKCYSFVFLNIVR